MKEQEYQRNAKDKTLLNGRIQLFIDKPISWLFAQFFATLGMLAIIFPLFFGTREVTTGLIIADVVSASVIFLSALVLNNSRSISVAFDVFGQVLLVERRTFFGVVTTERYDSKKIKQIKVDERVDSESGKTYQIQLELDDRSMVPLSTSYVYSCDSLTGKTNILREVVYGSGRSLEVMLQQKKKLESIPASVLLLVFIVLATPFGAHYFSRYGDLPRISVPTGAPTSEVLTLVQSKASSVLQADEKVVWVGQPELGREEHVKGWWTIGFAYIWTLFSIFWCFGAVGFKWKNLAHPFHALFLLFGLPFVGIGFSLLLLPYFSYKDDLTTIYLLTNRGAIQITNDRAFRLASFDSNDFGPLRITEYSQAGSNTNDRADLMFVSSLDEDGARGSFDGFWGISDYENVISLLQSHGVNRTR